MIRSFFVIDVLRNTYPLGYKFVLMIIFLLNPLISVPDYKQNGWFGHRKRK